MILSDTVWLPDPPAVLVLPHAASKRAAAAAENNGKRERIRILLRFGFRWRQGAATG